MHLSFRDVIGIIEKVLYLNLLELLINFEVILAN